MPPDFAPPKPSTKPDQPAPTIPQPSPSPSPDVSGAPAGVPQFLQGQPSYSLVGLRATFYTDPDPLAPYTVLREASPDVWMELDKAAKLHTLAGIEAAGSAAETPDKAAAPTWFNVPVTKLVRPWIPPAATGDLRSRLWPVVSSPYADPSNAGAIIRDEILVRWAAQNADVLGREVTIRLKDPTELPLTFPALTVPAAGGQPDTSATRAPAGGQAAAAFGQRVLEYTIQGKTLVELGFRVQSDDGSISPITLDLLGSNNMETIVSAVGAEGMVIAQAGDLLQTSTTLLQTETDFWNDASSRPDSVSIQDVDQHASIFSFGALDAQTANSGQGLKSPFDWIVWGFVQGHPEFSDELAPLVAKLMELSRRIPEISAAAHTRHEQNVQYLESEPGVPTADELTAVKKRGGVVNYLGYGLGRGFKFLANLFTGGYYDTRDEAQAAYKSGAISWNEMKQIEDAAAGRGAVVGLVTAALTIATAGLGAGIPALTATVGRTLLLAGGEGALTSMAGMTASTLVTRGKQFENPTIQAIWAQGEYTPGQIAFGGAVGFGTGVAFAGGAVAVGKLASWIKARPRIAGVEPGAGGLPPGWVADEPSPGVVRYRHPEIQGEIVQTDTGLQLQTTGPDGAPVSTEIPLGEVQSVEPATVVLEAPAAAAPALEAPVTGRPGPLPADVADELIASLEAEQPFRLDVSAKRAAKIQSGESNFVLDRPVTFDIDEPLAVGDPNIKPQRAVTRALDPQNRQLLDPHTNRVSKGLNVEPAAAARARQPLPAVSVDQEPSAIFTRRFGEVTELRQVFDEAVARIQNPGQLRPTALKNRINANMRDIIQNGRTPAGIKVRDALHAQGYKWLPGSGITAVR